jgi:SAM-dependent methyltransferase
MWRSLALPDAFHAEFTGERVIPGRVEENLFNEHLARYRFAARLAERSATILDAGCGAGYGTAELAKNGARVIGMDLSAEAMEHARANFSAAGVHFLEASCAAIPVCDGVFQMVAAFEVIEHLAGWRDFLVEVLRVLDPAGVFLVSTPNRLYYAESRQKAGPNPFHVHEFTEEEFRAELTAVFPHVKVLLQNHVEGIAFTGAETEGAAFEISERNAAPSSAHFFLAVCGKEALPPIGRFVFIPETGNVLQTRERHIALLDGEIRQKNQWIEQEKLERGRMMEKVRTMEGELEEHNRWARKANEEAERRAQLVAELQQELRKSNEWAQAQHAEAIERGERIVALQSELQRSIEWARARDAEAVERGERVVHLQNELQRSQDWAEARDAEALERGERVVDLQEELARATEWAQERDAELQRAASRYEALQLRMEREMADSALGYEAAIDQWRREKEAADQWAIETERRLSAERDAAREAFAGKQIEYESAVERIAELQAALTKLRAWAAETSTRMELIAQSRWVKLGRRFHVGPEIHRT